MDGPQNARKKRYAVERMHLLREAAIKGSLIMDRGFSLKGDICKLEVTWECDCPPGNSSSVNTNQQENFNVLDIDGDGNVTYSEFALSVGIIGNMTVCCN
ncbi:hypothetical protein OS493_038212 [Desmophyllum pertusum]|uniref:EF-hand domain-containing protein n=1 Tax=Desmophyllum pertusum TaxID=174260 RepID=A0A9W9Z6J1_9CNID|nr:hypothetical protein OS493_038212 [Desmophyllum pertusum]